MKTLVDLVAQVFSAILQLPPGGVSIQESATGEVAGASPEESAAPLERFVDGLTDTIPTLTAIRLTQWISSFGVVLLAVLVRRFVTGFLETRGMQWAQKSKTRVDDLLIQASTKPLGYFILFVGIYMALRLLGLPEDFFRSIAGLVRSILIITIGWLFIRLCDVAAEYLSEITQRTRSRLDDQLVPLIRKSLKIFVGILTFITVVQELGFNVSGLLAGLGIGGLAVALAARDSLANLFGSFVILLDRPFQVGDWVVADNVEGIVEEVGFRSTRIRTFAKTLITMPNSKLADAAINNWSRMPIRRVNMTVGVTYETTADQMEQAVNAIRQLLRDHPRVHQDFFLVYFTDFGQSSLDIFVYYFTTTTVWAEYLEVRQEINLAIMRALQNLGLEIAFPSRSIYLRDGRGGTFDPATLAIGAQELNPPAAKADDGNGSG